MRVVLITSLERGGPVEHSLLLARELARLGTNVGAVCATPELRRRFEEAGASVAEIPLRRTLDLSGAREVMRFCDGADVVHGQDRRSGFWARLWRRPRRPEGGRAVRVYTIHGVPDPYLPPPVGTDNPGLRHRLAYPILDAKLCLRADALVVPSEEAAARLERVGYPRDRMTVIPNGVEVPEQPARRDVGAVGTVSMLEPVKALDVFVRAAARIVARRADARFEVYGTGRDEQRLAALARALRLEGRLEFGGHVPLDQALARLSVFVLCSWFENSPMGLLEAMASGVPVVATAVGGIPEIAVDGTAQLVPPGDEAALAAAIERLLDEPELAAAQARAARERVIERYTAEANARATLDLYERLLESRR
ncbi:MAG: glycosyltransferase family 4 protein [Thermoleophilaceae bacterium]